MEKEGVIRLVREVPTYQPQNGVVYRRFRGKVDAVMLRATFRKYVAEANRVLAQMDAAEPPVLPIRRRR